MTCRFSSASAARRRICFDRYRVRPMSGPIRSRVCRSCASCWITRGPRAMAFRLMTFSAAVEAIRAGRVVGVVMDGVRRYDIVVKFALPLQADLDAIRNLPVMDPDGHPVPLAQLADIRVEEGPAQISREFGQRRLNVEANVRGRDLQSFVREARACSRRTSRKPEGYYLEWGGAFEQLERGQTRLLVVVPIALFAIFALLVCRVRFRPMCTADLHRRPPGRGWRCSGVVDSRHPVLDLGWRRFHRAVRRRGAQWRGHGLRVPSAPGRRARILREAVELRCRRASPTSSDDGSRRASLGFVPMALSTSAGAEVQRPLASVVIGGLVSSTMLTLILLPTLYAWLGDKR